MDPGMGIDPAGSAEEAIRMIHRQPISLGLLLAFMVGIAMLVPALAGPDFEVLMVGKSYVGKAYGAPDSTGQIGSVLEGYSLKVRILEALDCDHIDIVSGNSCIGEMHVLNDKETGFMTFRKSMPGSSFHLYRRQAPPRPEVFHTDYLPTWPERKWRWRPESEDDKEVRRWKPKDYIGTYVVEQRDAVMPRKIYAIRQVEGDDPE
jgi:hypothetical protein